MCPIPLINGVDAQRPIIAAIEFDKAFSPFVEGGRPRLVVLVVHFVFGEFKSFVYLAIAVPEIIGLDFAGDGFREADG